MNYATDTQGGIRIVHPDVFAKIQELEQQLVELKLEIIAATGQAQTALEENAKLRTLAQKLRDEIRLCHVEQCPCRICCDEPFDALAALLGGE